MAAVEALGATEASRFLDSLRMRTLVTRRLASVANPSRTVAECLAALSSTVARLDRMHGALEANLERLDQTARKLGIPIFGGKGISAHTTYADRSVRDFNDLDVFVRDHADAVALSKVLREEFGYRYQVFELPWFKLDPSDSMVYGQIALVAPEDDGDLLNTDIHFGDYSVRHCGRLHITGIFHAAQPGFHIVPLEENLACIVNNAAGDYFVTAKDTNDLLMALSLPAFDPRRLAGLLRRSHLDGFFGAIVAMLRGSSVLTEEQQRRLRALPTSRTLEPPPRPDTPSWNRRCLGTVVHAFATRRGDGLLGAAKVALNAFDYYRKPLKLTVAPDPAGPPDKLIGFNPWTCIRLVPIDLALGLLDTPPSVEHANAPAATSSVDGDPDFERLDVPAGTYFRIGDEFFVATVDYRLTRDLVGHAAGAAVEAR